MTKYIIPELVLGATAGYLNNNFWNGIPNSLISEQLYTATLIVMLFVFGFSFGRDKEETVKIRKTGGKNRGISNLGGAGKPCGRFGCWFVLGIDIASAVAVSSGFGWITLSGPLLGQILGPACRTLGFTANFFRELLTIITIPLMVKLDKYAPVASGKGTTMDIKIPLIVRYCGKDMFVKLFLKVAPFMITSIVSS